MCLSDEKSDQEAVGVSEWAGRASVTAGGRPAERQAVSMDQAETAPWMF